MSLPPWKISKLQLDHLAKRSISLFFGSPYANESLGQNLPRRLEIHIGELVSKYTFDYAPEEFRYQPPPPAILHNDEDSPVTMEQFVTRAHEHLNAYKEDTIKYQRIICDGMRENNGVEVRFFYWRVHAFGNDECAMISTHTIANVQFHFDGFWERQLNSSRRAEPGQQGRDPAPWSFYIQGPPVLPSSESGEKIIFEIRCDDPIFTCHDGKPNVHTQGTITRPLGTLEKL